MNMRESCLICHTMDVPLRPLSGYKSDKLPCNNQLQVILLLRKILRLRKSFVEHVLQKSGENPASWDLKLCSFCHRLFEEASFVSYRLNKLNHEFEELAESMRSKITPQTVGRQDVDDFGFAPGSLKGGCKRKVGRSPRKQDFTTQSEKRNCDWIQEEIRILALEGSKSKRYETSCHSSHRKFLVTGQIGRNKQGLEKRSSFSDGHTNFHIEEEACEDDFSVERLNSFDQEDDFIPADDPLDPESNHDNDEDYQVVEEQGDDDDSDYEPSPKRQRERSRSRSSKVIQDNQEIIVAKPIKQEGGSCYECSDCKKVFDTTELCDEHILQFHYGGKKPKYFSCHICEDKRFSSMYWMRYHLKMRHPGEKLPEDNFVDRSVEEGSLTELTYNVVPFGQVDDEAQKTEEGAPKPDETPSQVQKRYSKLQPDPPPDAFSVPVLNQVKGYVQYLVLSDGFFQMPEEVLKLITRGDEDKSCTICPKSYPTEMQLQGHIKVVHEGDQNGFLCPLCPRKSDRIVKLLEHMEQRHAFRSRPYCDQCGQSFDEDILLQAHIHRKHFGIENPYKCCVPNCDERFAARNFLNKHLKRVHKLQIAVNQSSRHHLLGRKPSGKTPKKSIAAIKTGRPKKGSVQRKTIPCLTCEEEKKVMYFVTEEELEVHVKRKHLGISRPYPCPICKLKFSTPSNLEKHMPTHTVRNDVEISIEEPAPPEEFWCHPCHKVFKSMALLKAHERSTAHTKHSPFVCEICSQAFRGFKSLSDHQTQMHYKELNIEPRRCDYCQKVFGSERHRQNHMKIVHTKNARYKCNLCNLCFEYEQAYKTHMNVRHTKKNVIMCPYCPKQFLNNLYLKYHYERVHSGIKPHECQFCSKKFSDKSTYNRHVEAHSNIIHDCPHCGKSGFKTRHALRVHVRTMHGDSLKRESEARIQTETVTPQASALVNPPTFVDGPMEPTPDFSTNF